MACDLAVDVMGTMALGLPNNVSAAGSSFRTDTAPSRAQRPLSLLGQDPVDDHCSCRLNVIERFGQCFRVAGVELDVVGRG